MMEQFLAGVRHLQTQLDTSLRAVDNLMAAKAAELKHLEQEIVRKHASLSGPSYTPDN